MSSYAYGDKCPVCGRTIKRRPVELTGRPCAECSEQYVTPRDKYRLRNARLTDATIQEIITDARARHDVAARHDAATRTPNATRPGNVSVANASPTEWT
jgi:hypothetical protein